MYEDNCAQLGWCTHIHHDHGERETLPAAADLIDTTDPAFEAVARLLIDLRDAGADLTEDTVRAAVKLGRHYHRREKNPSELINFQWSGNLDQEVVYYMRFGTLVKIGTSARFIQRFFTLRPDEVLAIEPGSYDLEHKRHRQFRHLHSHNEMFFPGRALIEHIRRVQKEHGKPRVGTPRKNSRPKTVKRPAQTIF